MNLIDIVFIVLLISGLALGFFQGTIRLLIAIVAFYVGIVLASLYFLALGDVFRRRFESSAQVGQITAFAMILLVSFLLLLGAGLYTFRYAHLPPSLDFIDRIIGSLLGLVLGALFLGIFAIVLAKLFIERDVAGSITFPIMGYLQVRIRTSFLLPYFRDYVLPLIYNSARPVLPREADFIFKIR